MEGGSTELSRAIKDERWRDLDLPDRDRALCEVAEKMSATPTQMVESDWKPLRDLGFDDEACLEVAHVVGIFNHLTRLADGMGLLLDPETEAAARSETGLSRPAPP